MQTAEHTLVTSPDGTRIAVWRSGEGPSLVLVHGTTADHSRWARVAHRFSKDFTVYAMDRRGRGESGDGDEYSLEREGEDVASLVDSIGGPVSLLGHSYGGLCAIDAALRTRNLHRLILYEPPLPGGMPIVPQQAIAALDTLIDQGRREDALVAFFRQVVGMPEAELEVVRRQPAWQARIAAAHTLSREVRVEGHYRLDLNRLRDIQSPTLLLLGGDSPQAFHDATMRLHNALPDSIVYTMPGQQHVAMDQIPDEFVRIVTAFAKPRS